MAISLRAVLRSPALRLLLLGSGLLLLWLALQWAAPSPPTSSNASQLIADSTQAWAARPSTTTGGPGFRYVLVLIILMAGALLALYLHRRNRPLHNTALLRPLGQLSLGPGQQIRLVACGDELLILGVTAHQITLLKSLPLPAELQNNHTPPSGARFAQLLTHISDRVDRTDHAS